MVVSSVLPVWDRGPTTYKEIKMMFETLLRQQATAIESLMANQPTTEQHMMDDARSELRAAIEKAIQASKHTAGE